MKANLITLIRISMAFVSAALFGRSPLASLSATVLMIGAIGLDAVDGWVARRFACASKAGAAFDIAGDRIVENIFWITFAKLGLISYWFPIVIIARGCLTDFIRATAFAEGKTAFGAGGMMETWWGKLLVGSRASRAIYGSLKGGAFFLLGIWETLASLPGFPIKALAGLTQELAIPELARLTAIMTVVACLVRGLPVLIEGARFFKKSTIAEEPGI